MIKKLSIVAAALLLVGCVSNQLRGFVGEPIEEAYFAYGEPQEVMDLQDGHKAYLFRFGADVLSDGCIMTLLTKPTDAGDVVESYRVPKGMVC